MMSICDGLVVIVLNKSCASFRFQRRCFGKSAGYAVAANPSFHDFFL